MIPTIELVITSIANFQIGNKTLFQTFFSRPLKLFKEGPIWTKFDFQSRTCNSKNENPLGNNPHSGVGIHFLAFSHICENMFDLVTFSQLTFFVISPS
jgi:hypothetical protein